jgi:hypothetical protein
MNQPIPDALANTVLLADHDEATQRAVVDAVEMIVVNYLRVNMTDILTYHQDTIERLALRALKHHFVNASNIY